MPLNKSKGKGFIVSGKIAMCGFHISNAGGKTS
jgi:hypothetical protein